MTPSIQSSSLLEQPGSTVLTQRLFRTAPEDPNEATPADVLGNLAFGTETTATSFEKLIADLNAARAQQSGMTYSPTGTATRGSANTILVGYG